ncbi:hypothetical protein ABMA27_005449 [Loxostege sticticalis]|uniref:CCHC-type domain-containing protein n=1 Tax=Loxostege sticticalis TaxID=481309 RepID=A0ABR3HJ68_LOXSC
MSVKEENTSKSEKLTINVLTKFIKSYSGDRDTLPAFLTNCDNAISLAQPEQHHILCKYIISQLDGKAQLACSLKTFETWPELKSFLKSTFGEKKHSQHLLSDLQNCKQLHNESVTQFSLRIESCLTRLQADIHNSCTDKTQLSGRIAAMEDLALNTFIMGLKPNISTIVRCRDPTTLNDAITHAVSEEKLTNLNSISQRTLKTCSTCKKQGHLSHECFHNKNNKPRSFTNNYHVPASSYPNKKPFHPNNNYNEKFCAYCKHKGHIITECRKRQYNNQHRGNNSSQPEPSAHTSSAAASPRGTTNASFPTRVHCCDTSLGEDVNLNVN